MRIKDSVFQKLDNQGYITDQESYEIYGREPNFVTLEEYKRQWRRLQADREFFKDKIIVSAHKGNKRALVDTPDGSYIVGREYFDEIVKDMVEDKSRPDLKLKMYKQK